MLENFLDSKRRWRTSSSKAFRRVSEMLPISEPLWCWQLELFTSQQGVSRFSWILSELFKILQNLDKLWSTFPDSSELIAELPRFFQIYWSHALHSTPTCPSRFFWFLEDSWKLNDVVLVHFKLFHIQLDSFGFWNMDVTLSRILSDQLSFFFRFWHFYLKKKSWNLSWRIFSPVSP